MPRTWARASGPRRTGAGPARAPRPPAAWAVRAGGGRGRAEATRARSRPTRRRRPAHRPRRSPRSPAPAPSAARVCWISDEGHHGGVWKIAFADFMTAMMAFFLVMWLTNSSDMATRKQVAQYFNPIKLNDSSPATRGVEFKRRRRHPGLQAERRKQGQDERRSARQPAGRRPEGRRGTGAVPRPLRCPRRDRGAERGDDRRQGAGAAERHRACPASTAATPIAIPSTPRPGSSLPNETETGGKQDAAPPAEFKTAVLSPDAPLPADPASPQTSATLAKTKGGDGKAEKGSGQEKDQGGLAKVTQSEND